MSDKWEKAVRGMRESMETNRRRHRPAYAIIARTAWDEEWAEEPWPTEISRELMLRAVNVGDVLDFIASLSRDPRFLEAGKR